jgi:hypothetical protein
VRRRHLHRRARIVLVGAAGLSGRLRQVSDRRAATWTPTARAATAPARRAPETRRTRWCRSRRRPLRRCGELHADPAQHRSRLLRPVSAGQTLLRGCWLRREPEPQVRPTEHLRDRRGALRIGLAVRSAVPGRHLPSARASSCRPSSAASRRKRIRLRRRDRLRRIHRTRRVHGLRDLRLHELRQVLTPDPVWRSSRHSASAPRTVLVDQICDDGAPCWSDVDRSGTQTGGSARQVLRWHRRARCRRSAVPADQRVRRTCSPLRFCRSPLPDDAICTLSTRRRRDLQLRAVRPSCSETATLYYRRRLSERCLRRNLHRPELRNGTCNPSPRSAAATRRASSCPAPPTAEVRPEPRLRRERRLRAASDGDFFPVIPYSTCRPCRELTPGSARGAPPATKASTARARGSSRGLLRLPPPVPVRTARMAAGAPAAASVRAIFAQ